MRPRKPKMPALLLALAAATLIGRANAAETLRDSIAAGVPIIDLRMRFEEVEQANRPKHAIATTLRARLGYQTGNFRGFSALTDVDIVQHVGAAAHVHATYGREWDAQLEGQIDSHLAVTVAYAGYTGAGPFPDKRIFWTYATYRF